MDLNATIGINLWNYRREKGITRDELSSMSGVSTAGIRRIEELHNDAKVSTLALLAGALEIEITDLFKPVPKDMIQDRSKKYEVQQKIKHALYPDQPANYSVYSLRLFLLFLPLFEPTALADAIGRIRGQCYGYEGYLLAQLQRLYDRIPFSPAKLYADTMADLDCPLAMQRQQDVVRSRMEDAAFDEGQRAYTQALNMFLKRLDETLMSDVEALDRLSSSRQTENLNSHKSFTADEVD